MEYRTERAHLVRLAEFAQLAEPTGGVHAARAVVQALTATGAMFDDAITKLDAVHPQLAAHLPAWYTAIRAIGAECVIVARWWTEELGGENLRWTTEHDARLAEDVAHFEQLRAAAVDELDDRAPAVFASVAMPDGAPWEENLPPRERRWHLLAWPVVAAAALGVGAYGLNAWHSAHPTMSGVLNGNGNPAPAAAAGTISPSADDDQDPTDTPPAVPIATSASPTTPPTTAAIEPAPTTARPTAPPAPRRTTKPAAPHTTATPSVEVSLIPADGTPQIEAIIQVTTSSTAATPLYVASYGTTSSGTRTAENIASQTLSGKTFYSYAEVINTSAWCGDTVTVEATSVGGSAAAQTGAGCAAPSSKAAPAAHATTPKPTAHPTAAATTSPKPKATTHPAPTSAAHTTARPAPAHAPKHR